MGVQSTSKDCWGESDRTTLSAKMYVWPVGEGSRDWACQRVGRLAESSVNAC